MNDILRQIKAKRLQKGFSQEQMGRKLNMVASAYGKIEREQTELTLRRLTDICNILELNSLTLAQQFIDTQSDKSPNLKFQLTEREELVLSRKIVEIYRGHVNLLLDLRYHEIMREYPFTEFTAQDLWDSLEGNKEELVGMSEAEFFDTFGGGYQEVFEPEHEYEGFKKLVEMTGIFFFFVTGLVTDTKFMALFSKYLSREQKNWSVFSPNFKSQSRLFSYYIESLEAGSISEIIQRFELQNTN